MWEGLIQQALALERNPPADVPKLELNLTKSTTPDGEPCYVATATATAGGGSSGSGTTLRTPDTTLAQDGSDHSQQPAPSSDHRGGYRQGGAQARGQAAMHTLPPGLPGGPIQQATTSFHALYEANAPPSLDAEGPDEWDFVGIQSVRATSSQGDVYDGYDV